MTKTFNELTVLQGGARLPNGATGFLPKSDASGNLTLGVLLYVQSTTPSPPVGAGEYVWFVTDGSGGITDIRSGTA